MSADETGPGLMEALRADYARAVGIERGVTPQDPSSLRAFLGMIWPRRFPVLLVRISHSWSRLGIPLFPRLIAGATYLVYGLEFGQRTRIGPGLYLPHTQGTVIGAWSIGRNATIFHQVTIGAKVLDFEFDRAQRPAIGDDVTIGAGAKVLGGIIIGDRVTIGANTVVVDDVPSDKAVVGASARFL